MPDNFRTFVMEMHTMALSDERYFAAVHYARNGHQPRVVPVNQPKF